MRLCYMKGISVCVCFQFTCPVGVAAVIWSLDFYMNIHGILQSEQAAKKKIIFSKSLIWTARRRLVCFVHRRTLLKVWVFSEPGRILELIP